MEPPVSVLVNDSMDGGYEGAMRLSSMNPLPDCLLCTSDNIALGALKAFHQKGIRIPEDIEMISVGQRQPGTAGIRDSFPVGCESADGGYGCRLSELCLRENHEFGFHSRIDRVSDSLYSKRKLPGIVPGQLSLCCFSAHF